MAWSTQIQTWHYCNFALVKWCFPQFSVNFRNFFLLRALQNPTFSGNIQTLSYAINQYNRALQTLDNNDYCCISQSLWGGWMQKLKLFPEDVSQIASWAWVDGWYWGGGGDMSPYTFMRTYFCFTDDCHTWVTSPSWCWCWCWWVRPQLSASEAARQTRYLAVSGDLSHRRFCLWG